MSDLTQDCPDCDYLITGWDLNYCPNCGWEAAA